MFNDLLNSIKECNLDAIIEVISHCNNEVVVDDLTNEVISRGNAEYIYRLARAVGYNKKIEDAIIKTKDPQYIYLFAKNVEDSNLDKLADAIIEIANIKYIIRFAENIEGAPIGKLICALIIHNEIHKASLLYKKTEDLSIEDLTDMVIDYGNFDLMLDFIKYFSGVKVEKIIEYVYKQKDPKKANVLIPYVTEEYIDTLADVIINYGTIQDMYELARDTSYPIDKVIEGVNECEDVDIKHLVLLYKLTPPELTYKFNAITISFNTMYRVEEFIDFINRLCNSLESDFDTILSSISKDCLLYINDEEKTDKKQKVYKLGRKENE